MCLFVSGLCLFDDVCVCLFACVLDVCLCVDGVWLFVYVCVFVVWCGYLFVRVVCVLIIWLCIACLIV